MSKYSTMDDGAINMLVGESLGLTSYYLNHDRSVQFRNEKGHIKGAKNYCNNPADAWPIIHDNRIGISPSGEIWHAYSSGEDFVCSISNPLRAAMIVFLMMKDAEKCDG